jgi:hypothetical protein
VGKHLKKLTALLLAERKLDGTWISHRRPWDEVAEELGMAGTRDRKAAQHAQERADHRQQCIDSRSEWEADLLAQGWQRLRGSIFIPPASA